MRQGWKMKKFEELIQENQIGLIKSTKEQGNDKAFRYLKMDSITSDNNLVHNKYVYVDAKNDELEKFTLNDGDFLFNTRNSYELVGKTCVFSPIDDEPTLFNNNIMRVVFKNGISSKFINYAFSSKQVKERLQKLKSGTTSVVGIYYNGLRNLEIPLPPLPEQQRIVAILDEVFAEIDRAKANTERNLKNAKELFESYLQGVFEIKGEDWEEKKLGEVLVKTETIDPTKKPNERFTYLDVSSVNKESKEIENVTVLLGKDAPSRARKLVRTNDVIFATVRPTHSRVALITEEYDEQVCSTGYFVLRAKEFLNNNLVYYFLLTFSFNKQMEKLQKGASYPAVTDSEVKGIYISFPKSLKEQQTIVRQLDDLRTETQKLEAVYHKKLADLGELKKSILQKTFTGELTTV
jgi:type I restriction enzyme S subunit